MKKISLPQKKIIIISLIVILAFLIFGLFIYLPSKNTVTKIKSELFSKKNQIQEIEVMIGKAKTIVEGIKLIKERYRQLNNKFPQKEEGSLRMLSDFARKLNIELISIKPQPKRVFLDEDDKKIEIEGKICQSVYVSIEMKCLYKDLVKYIETLKESLPAFVTIERLKINKYKSADSRLNVTLELNLYLLS